MEDSRSFFYLSDIKRLFFKKKLLFFLVFISFFLLAFVFFVRIEPHYSFEASFFEDIDKNKSKAIGSLKDIVLSTTDSSTSDAMSFFQTKKMAKKIVKKLALQISNDDQDNFFQNNYKIALKNLRFEFNKKIKDPKTVEYADVYYKKNKSSSYFLRFLDESSFQLLNLEKQVLLTSKVGAEAKIKDLSFKIKSIPNHIYKIPMIGLRYFTVYGPYGRPDMAYFKFTKNILDGKEIEIYNQGNMQRDFTYIDDIIDGTISALDKVDSFKIYNLGNNSPINLLKFIDIIEKKLNIKAIKKFKPFQKGEMLSTYADINASKEDLMFNPTTKIEDGMDKFIDWYLNFHS